VLEAKPPAFYGHGLLKPYVVFDVAHGQEQRGGASGGSLRNEARALRSVPGSIGPHGAVAALPACPAAMQPSGLQPSGMVD
jgi:hypothetical protein